MTSPVSSPDAHTNPQRPSGPIPPTTAASALSDVFAFQPPSRVEDFGTPRQQTSSSFSTEPPVVTPPTGLSLSEVALFNGHRPTRSRLPTAYPNTTSTLPPFAFSPPASQSTNLDASPPNTGTPSIDSPFGYRPPSTDLHGAARASLASSRHLPSAREARIASMGHIQEGSSPSGSHASSSVSMGQTCSSLSEKLEAGDFEGIRDKDVEIGRDRKLESDVKSSLTPHITPKAEPYLDHFDDSPYPEVRASVSNTDDVEMPCLTFRVLVIGVLLCASGSAANIFFTFRYPSPYLSSLLVLLFAHPCGVALAWLLPLRCWSLPPNLPIVGGWEFSLNPSPWTIKEHTLIFIMSTPAINPDYGLGIISAMEKRRYFEVSLGFTVLFLLSTQLIGISLAGLTHKILIQPASFIWPSSLVYCVVLNTLHAGDAPAGGMTRVRFFGYATVIAFLYYFLPGFLFTALSYFSFVCWIRPSDTVVNQLFGTVNGLGMGLLTFDWNQIAYLGSPLMYPFWSQLNIMAGFVMFYWIIIPVLYYSDVWKTGHLPISGTIAYDRFAQPYNISRVITPDNRFNVTAYEEYSPLYLPVNYVMTYLLAFLSSTALVVHTVLHYGPEALRRLKGEENDDDDVHARLMKKYPEVPSWYYWAIFAGCTVMAIIAVKIENVGMPVWAPLLALLIAIIYALPMGYAFAMTGQLLGNNLIAQVIPGRLFPGSALGNMIFKGIAVQSTTLMVNTSLNLKLAHYMKCGPKPVFFVQVVGALVGVATQTLVKTMLFRDVHDICDPNQPSLLSCPMATVLNTSSMVWGSIGPTRQFGSGSIYSALPYAAIVGALLPVPLWLWLKRHPTSRLKHVHIPVIFGGPLWAPPAGGINFSSWFIVGVVFQYWLRRTRFQWWAKYNYVLSAALDTGTILGAIVTFLALQLPKSGPVTLNWWGNTVWTETADFAGTPYYNTDPVEGF